MDWALAVRRNREQLKAIVLALFALAGMRVGGSLFTLPRATFAAIMAVLRPAESAVRRLILIAAQGLKPIHSVRSGADAARLADLPPRGGQGSISRNAKAIDPVNRLQTTSARSHATGWAEVDRGGRAAHKAFRLFDTLKSFDPEAIWDTQPVWESGFDLPHYTSTLAVEDPPLDATRLATRLNSLIRALDTIPHQARRLLRWQAKRDALLKARKPTRLSPMRPGLPPGWRQRPVHEIDTILKECHGLANDLLSAADTS